MSFRIITDPVPLRVDASGVVRVGNTRVSLDIVIHAYNEGAIPEEIAEQYPVLQLPDIYAVITYYLKHQDEVAAYLDERRQQRERVRRENERRANPSGLRERLLSRMKSQDTE
jgi:uncharacterized protein (DUF433 family)